MSKLYSITGGGLKPLVVENYAIGTLVRFTGDMANPAGVGAIVAIRAAGQYGTKSYDVALMDGRQFCGTFLDGSRWEVSEEIATPDVLEVLRAGVVAKEAADKAKASSAAQAFAQSVEKLKADYPHLTQGGGPVIAAKNLRVELKRAFPGVAFSVRTKSYSGGNNVTVAWTDGPNTAQVQPIADKYAGGHFDGMTDSYEYKRSPWTEVFGEARYTFCERRHSAAAVASAIRTVSARYHYDGIAPPSVEDWQMGRANGSPIRNATHHDDWQSLISRELQKRTWTLTQETA